MPPWLTALVRMLIDGSLAGLALVVAYALRFEFQLGGDVPAASDQPLSFFYGKIVLFAALAVIVFHFKGLYRLPRWSTLLDETWIIASGTVLAMAGVILIAFFDRFNPSRLVFASAVPIAIGLLICARVLYRFIRERIWARGIGVDRVLVIGGGRAAHRILQWLLGQPHMGYKVVGYVDQSPRSELTHIATSTGVQAPAYLGTIDELRTIASREQVDEVIIALSPSEHERSLSVMNLCRQMDIEFKLVPDLYTMALDHVDIHEVAGLPLIGLKPATISGWNFAVKRAMDIALSLFILIAFGWLLVLIAIAIKFDSRGPVFFRQERVGRNGRRFHCYKFRTMVTDAEARKPDLQKATGRETLLFKMKDDPRRTRVGRWLRQSSLDEAPQFFNVLLGEMSVVGPRPMVPVEVAEYQDWHFERLLVPPGMTGLWQVNGRSNLTFDEMVRLDLYYAENWSPWLDVKTIIRTVPAVLTARGAY